MTARGPERRANRPDFTREQAHGGVVAGVDEAGRGPLAGPVVAAAVVFADGVPDALAALLDDSKRLSASAREAAYAALLKSGAQIGVGAASVGEILRLNILRASLLAMRRAVLRLPERPGLALVDGNQAPALPCPVQCYVGGDGASLSIAAASIVAKVVRDRAMSRLARRYPAYGWDANAGYGTAAHRAALERIGACRHHRTGFGTVRRMLADRNGDRDGDRYGDRCGPGTEAVDAASGASASCPGVVKPSCDGA